MRKHQVSALCGRAGSYLCGLRGRSAGGAGAEAAAAGLQSRRLHLQEGRHWQRDVHHQGGKTRRGFRRRNQTVCRPE